MVASMLLPVSLLLTEPMTDVDVTFEAPSSCPSRDQFVSSVEGYVGSTLAEEGVKVRVEIVQDESYVLKLEFIADGGSVTETLTDPDCAVVVDAAAVRLGFAIDPDATSRALAEPEAAPEPEPKPGPDCYPGPSQLGSGTLTPRCAALGLRGGVQVGPLPSFGPGVGGHVAALWPRLRLELGLVHWFSQHGSAEAGARGEVRLMQIDVAACGRLGFATVEFPLCAGLELGSLHGEGVGLDAPREDRILWAAALVHGRVSWSPIRRFAVYWQPVLVVPFAPYRFRVNGDELVHEVAAAGFRGVLGLELRLP